MKLDDVIGDTGVGGVTSLQMQLAAILAELRLLTVKVKEDTRDKRVAGEWKFMAMVIDRLCFYIFIVLFFVATLVVFRHQLF